MNIVVHAHFKKQYQTLRRNQKNKFKERRDIFLRDPFHPLLNNHPLRGKYNGYRSINIGGDLRVVYRVIAKDTAYFVAIGPHRILYRE